MLLFSVSATPTDAATAQGFEWGITEPYIYNMDMLIQVNETAVYDWLYPVNESIYLNITDTPTIPEAIDEWGDIISPTVYGHWANGSGLSLSWVFNQALDVIVPVGNFSLLSTLAEELTSVGPSAAEPDVFIDNFFLWGCRYSVDLAPERWDVEITFYKRRGLLVNYTVDVWDASAAEYLGNISVVCDRQPPVVHALIVCDVPDGFRYWTAIDDNPGAYEIHLVQGEELILLQQGFWNSTGEMIGPPLEGLGWGTHAFRATFYDASGLASSDIAQRTLGPSLVQVMLLGAIIATGIVAVAVCLVWRKK